MRISLRPAASMRARFASSRASPACSCSTCARGAPRSIAATRCSIARDRAGTSAFFASARSASDRFDPVPLASTAARSSSVRTPDPTSPTRPSASRSPSPAARHRARNSRTVGSSSSIRATRRRARAVRRCSQTMIAASARSGVRTTATGPPRPLSVSATAITPPAARPTTAHPSWVARKPTTSASMPAWRSRRASASPLAPAPQPAASRSRAVRQPSHTRVGCNGVSPTGSAMSRT